MSLTKSLKKKGIGLKSPPHLIVIARAGTGKTTTLIEGVKILQGNKSKFKPSPQQRAIWKSMKLSKDAKTITFCCFNRAIQRELQDRIPDGCEARTLHSMGNQAIREVYGNLTMEKGRTQMLLSEMMDTDIWKLRKYETTLLVATERIVELCKANLLDGEPEEIDRITSTYDIDVGDDTERIHYWVPRLLEASATPDKDGMFDYNDMIWLPIVNKLNVPKRDLLLVDEAQDLNKAQQALAIKAGKRLVLVGDDRQAIYGFTGADSQSLRTMCKRLGGEIDLLGFCDTKFVKVLPMTVTRRCGRAIVAEAQELVPDFEAHESNGEGCISYLLYGDEEGVDNYRSAVEDGDMVLCRVNAPLVQQCFRFLREGRKADIQGREIGKGLISTINQMKCDNIRELSTSLQNWHLLECRKENAKKFPNESRLMMIGDRYACLTTFMEDCKTIKAVIERIQSVFTDEKTSGIRLSTIHKAKGLEADRVFLLRPKEAPIPHPMARTPEAVQQEYNCLYVAITRAIKELIYVS